MARLPLRGARSRLLVGLASVQLLGVIVACGGTTSGASAPSATVESAKPSNPGGPGEAATLPGDAKSGAAIFAANCVPCHVAEGKGGVTNADSTDGIVPALNPIDDTLVSKDTKVYASNVDHFIQHGSTPAGTSPEKKMAAWGDTGQLKQQQIADVIAYSMSLNPAK
jgi:mono/diheme cytochrome c family protein